MKNILQRLCRGMVRRWGPALDGLLTAVRHEAVREQFARWTRLDPKAQVTATAIVRNLAADPERISVGANTYVCGELLVFAHGGRIRIGQSCYIGDGSRIWSADDLAIGDRVLISHGVNIHDTNSHSSDAQRRHEHYTHITTRGHPTTGDLDIKSAPVSIGDDVWIGFGAAVLKGVRIGRGAIVAACAVVTEDVPAWTMVAGNPARVLARLPVPDARPDAASAANERAA